MPENKLKEGFTFEQGQLLDNMEFYLRRKGDEATDIKIEREFYKLAAEIKASGGWCHGFALYFLSEIAKDFESKSKDSHYLHDHFDDLYKMASWDRKELSPALDEIFKKVIERLHKLQNPAYYSSTTIQSDIEVITEGELERDRSYYDIASSFQSFLEFLTLHIPKNSPILIESSNHATALYRNGVHYYCRNSNDPLGLWTVTDIEHVAEYFFEQFKELYKKTDTFQLPFTFNICKTPNKPSCNLETYEEYVAYKKKTDPGFIYRKSSDGATVLWQAVTDGNMQATKLLLDMGAEFDPRRNVIEFARHFGQEDMLNLLLSYPNFNPLLKNQNDENQNDVNVNGLTETGETLLQVAMKNYQYDEIYDLLKKNADIFIKNKNGKSSLETAIERCLEPNKNQSEKENTIKILKILLNRSPNTQELRNNCLNFLLKNPQMMSEQNPQAAFALIDKYSGSELAYSINNFLTESKLKVEQRTSWTSMFKKQPIENDEKFKLMLQKKIAEVAQDPAQNVNSPNKLNDIVLDVMKEFIGKKFSDDFQNRLNFTTKYLGHCVKLEKENEELLDIDFKSEY